MVIHADDLTMRRSGKYMRATVAFMLLLALADTSRAADHRLGFAVQVKGEGFFLNPIVTKILVTEVTKGAVADAAGMKAGDQIIQIEGQNVAGKRARELQSFVQLNPGDTRILRLKHADGTEVDVRITKPKTQ